MYVRQMYYKLGRLPDQKTSIWDQKIHKAIPDLKKTIHRLCWGRVFVSMAGSKKIIQVNWTASSMEVKLEKIEKKNDEHYIE